MTALKPQVWTELCPFDALTPERGVAALVSGIQVALFRTFDDRLYAIDNTDPFTGAAVLSRGVVGDRGGEPTVASPLHKQVFSLASGRCLDDDTVSVRAHPIRLNDGRVEVSVGST